MERHYCTYCGKKRSEENLTQVYYKLLKKKAWHCTDHTSTNADFLQIISKKKGVFLELFSGSKEVSKIAESYGYETFSIDINPKFAPSLICDILKVKLVQLPRNVEIVWASIPCTVFSILSIGKHWEKVNYSWRKYFYIPKTEEAKEAIRIVEKTLWLINNLNPTYFVIENPRGALRHLPQVRAIPFRHTVSYSNYGFDYYKPTDLFTNCPGLLFKKLPYHVGNTLPGSVNSLPSAYERSLVPDQLIHSILSQMTGFVAPGLSEITGQ